MVALPSKCTCQDTAAEERGGERRDGEKRENEAPRRVPPLLPGSGGSMPLSIPVSSEMSSQDTSGAKLLELGGVSTTKMSKKARSIRSSFGLRCKHVTSHGV